MGVTTVKLTIKNPLNGGEAMEEEFLVDTGVHYTVVPRDLVQKLGIKKSYTQEFALADGKIIKRDIGSAFINADAGITV